jgi:uncharacterized alkaline shock family protein YloU
MTDVTSGAPAAAAPSTPPTPPPAPATPAAPQPAAPAPEQSTAEAVKERAGEVLEQAGEAVQVAADKVQQAAGNVVTRIRNNAVLPAGRGKTIIANEVVEKIAGIAAREVPGVYDLGGDAARLFTAVKERLHLGEESANQGVSVRLEGKKATIEIVIVIEFGFQVFSVTEKVREKVISSVENLLGLEVAAVDVTVDDVHIDDDAPTGNDVERAAGYNPETTAIVVGAPPAS